MTTGCLALAACSPGRASRPDTSAGARALAPSPGAGAIVHASPPEPLVIGDSFTIDSAVLAESRRVNVLVPTVYGEQLPGPMPALYMLDGGTGEDFLHIAGLVQILVSNGGMRPCVLVGIENTSRRRDMTGPTAVAEDLRIAPVVGGSAAFRRFIREELMPTIRARYPTTGEAAIVGESLAGLFVVETFFLERDLFRGYIAIDPSLWWAGGELVNTAASRLGASPPAVAAVFLASSDEPALARLTAELAAVLESHRSEAFTLHYAPMPEESHATVYHPAALRAFRAMFPPEAEAPE